MDFTWTLVGGNMDYMDFRWSLLGVYKEYMESTWSPQGLVGECQVQEKRPLWVDHHKDSTFFITHRQAMKKMDDQSVQNILKTQNIVIVDQFKEKNLKLFDEEGLSSLGLLNKTMTMHGMSF
jgi:hypothetical protein